MSPKALEAILLSRLAPERADWLRETLASLATTGESSFISAWSSVGRRLGRERMALAPDAQDSALHARSSTVDEWGRILLLARWLGVLSQERQVAVVDELYRTGDLGEKQALLRALPHLPDAGRFTPIGIEAVRSNAVSVLEAIACENAYPAAHFSDEAFNQMVLKALFNGVSLRRIVGLDERRTPELVRMVDAYAKERRAAGRAVPEDVALVAKGGRDAAV